MQRFSLPLYALLAALGLAGCQAKDAPVAAGASVGAVTPVNAAQERRPDLELRETIMYPLEMNKVRAMASITKEMSTKEFTAAAEKGQAANEPPADQMSNDNSVAESIAYANGNPAAREVIRKNGMTARDFIMTGYALIHARVGLKPQRIHACPTCILLKLY